MDIGLLIQRVSDQVSGLPLLIFVATAAVIYTVALRGIQFRYFMRGWRETLQGGGSTAAGDMTPLQAFVNTLGASIGNGSIAGVATAVYAGGPGSLFWLLVFGCLMMAIRFAEVYISTLYGKNYVGTASTLGGPMLYLQDVPAGQWVAWLYAVTCIFFGLLVGNGVQTNSISLAMHATTGLSPFIIAAVLLVFVAYLLCGGAARIVKIADMIVPIKVVVFFAASFVIIAYHIAELPSALLLIFQSAFSAQAIAGAALGATVFQAMRYGLNRSVMATESGLGTIAILFGFTGSAQPLRSALMGMIGTFVSTLVCFLVGLTIVMSGVWDSGLTSTALTLAAYNTVFGSLGGPLISFLAISFGAGVLVAYAYITRAAFLYVTKGKYESFFIVIYCAAAFMGAVINAQTIFAAGDIPLALLLALNVYGLLALLPRLKAQMLSE
jgi:AGCS family alanine or glycine:cation symporter